jgi:glucose/arabinose dehydrogenase
MKIKIHFLLFVVVLCCVAGFSNRSFAQLNISTRIVKDSLFIPWEIIYGPDDHIWFTQKNGYICRLDPANGHTDTLYHETATVILNGGEGGMLGMALHPSFASQPYVYVAYEYLNGASNYRERVVRYTYNNNVLQSPQVLLDDITGANYHNGCRLLIAGDKLFISTGDATVGSNAQNLQSMNGKILRINLDGTIPADNPIAGNPAWSWGHRNPEGLVFANGMLYSSEHGPSNDDEINIIRKGRNYGWPSVEGFCNLPAEQAFCADSNVAEPLITWTPTIAPAGVEYYDLPMFAGLQKSLLLATLKDQHLYQLQLNAAKDSIVSAQVVSGVNFGRLRDLCLSPAGSIFISTSNSTASGTGAKVDRIIELYNPSFNGVAEAGKQLPVVSVYPNPVGDELLLSVERYTVRGRLSGEITDLQGRVIERLAGHDVSKPIAVADLAPGVYFLRVQDGERVLPVQRFVKQ